MKYLFVTLLTLLILGSLVTIWTSPDMASDVPVLYWVSDANPARYEQIKRFHQWLVDNGYTNPNDPTRPCCELRLDTSVGSDKSKFIIQCVSGVGGDIMDLGSAEGDMPYLAEIGMLEDVTEKAKEMGFDPSKTWPAIESEITILDEDGKRHQYQFPCNVYTEMLYVNKELFRKYGMDIPPETWTFGEFERVGKEFVAKANKGKQFQDIFFCGGLELTPMHRSLGLSIFNETLTRCTVDDPRYARMLNLKRKWITQDHIMPSEAEVQSFSTASGYSGAGPQQLFYSGNYAMIALGRWVLINLREFGTMDLSLSMPPHGGYPNISLKTRAATIYKGGKHKDKAMLFLKFLASESYNNHIVEDADAMPPNPAYSLTEEFNHPPQYPNEWGVHERFARAIREHGIGSVFSPFISPATTKRLLKELEDAHRSDRGTAEELSLIYADKVNREVERKLQETPDLRPRYEKMVKLQEKIDQQLAAWKAYELLKAQGKDAAPPAKMSVDDIPNTFYRRYYKDKGWAE